jgi:hypothetical protein
MKPLRVVFYAVNGSGLGHVTRLVAIARWMRRLETLLSGTPPELVFLTSTEATSILADHRLAAFKLPSKGTARQTGLDVLEHRRLAKHFVWQMLGVMAPDLLVVDTFPQGSFDELLPVLDGPFAKVLVLRAVKPEYAQRPVFQASARLYDRIIVPHPEGSEPALAKGLPSDRPAAWVGDILNLEAEASDRGALRAELGVQAETLVYLSAGGGGDPTSERTLETLVTALAAREDVHLLVGAGPLYKGRRLHGPRLTWFDRSDVSRFFPAVDAAIAAAGYNTFHELLHLGVPTAFFAQAKIADEQARRIASAVSAGAALGLPAAEALGVDAIASALSALLTDRGIGARARLFSPDNGARWAAAHALMAHRRGRSPSSLTPLHAAELLTPRLVAALDRLGEAGDLLLRNGLAHLFPDAELERLEERRALASLLPSLSPEARAEVAAAMETRAAADGLGALEAGMVALCAAVAPQDAGLLAPLIEVATKKHPRTQEVDQRYGPWVSGLTQALAELLGDASLPLTASERATLYRAFPRLADATLGESMATFRAILTAHGHLGVAELQRRFQLVKLGQRRVERQHLTALMTRAAVTTVEGGV